MANFLTVPNEIKLKIFQLLIEDTEVNFTLMAVCRDWKNLIQHEAIFWRHILINEHSVLHRPLSSPQEIFFHAEFALKHSRGLPIDIVIQVPDLYEPSPRFHRIHAGMLTQILRREAHRIASISISGNDWEMHLSILAGFHGIPMPLLHTFNISIWEYTHALEHYGYNEQRISLSPIPVPILQYPSDDDDMSKVNTWGQKMYPNLQHISIKGAPFNWRTLPTSGLKTLTLGHQPADTSPPLPLIQELLSFAAPSLEELSVLGPFPFQNATQATILPNLTKLSLTYKSPDECALFLPYIRAPALKQLHLKDTVDRFGFRLTSWHVDMCTDAMLRAMILCLPLHQLEALIIEDVAFKDKYLTPPPSSSSLNPSLPFTIHFLASLTSLKHLYLTEWGNFLQLLNHPGAAQGFAYLPQLETLHVDGVVDDILRFLTDRVQIGRQRNPLYIEVGEMADGDLDAKQRDAVQEMIKKLAR